MVERVAEKPMAFDMKNVKIRKDRVRLEKTYDWKGLDVGKGFTVDNSIAATVRAGAHGYTARCKKEGSTVKFQSQKNTDKKTTSIIRVA